MPYKGFAVEYIPGKKRCHGCGQVKEDASFGRDKRKNDGLTARCKACLNAKAKEWYAKGPHKKKVAPISEPDPNEVERKCGRCRAIKPIGGFNRNRRALRGYQRICRKCQDEHINTFDERHPGRRLQSIKDWNEHTGKERRLFYDYGLTRELYEEMLANQGGVCAICGCPERSITKKGGKVRALAVDHDHATGEVRGLLCGMCNNGLGNFKDNPALLESAIQYLNRSSRDAIVDDADLGSDDAAVDALLSLTT